MPTCVVFGHWRKKLAADDYMEERKETSLGFLWLEATDALSVVGTSKYGTLGSQNKKNNKKKRKLYLAYSYSGVRNTFAIGFTYVKGVQTVPPLVDGTSLFSPNTQG